MRKLIAVLCVVAMMMVMAVPAFANPSVDVPVIPATPGVVVSSLGEDDPAANITNEDAKAVVESVNGEGHMTPSEAVKALANAELTLLDENGEELNAADLAELEDYSFSSQFNSISAPEFPVDVEFEGTDMNTKIMLIGEDGNVYIITPNEDGTFTFPVAGTFALLDPTPAE